MKKVIETLKKRGFLTIECDNAEDAKKYLLNEIPPDKSVGIGGSVTIEQLQIYEDLINRGNTIYWHWKPQNDIFTERMNASSSDVYLCSVNALLTDGRMINIDGTGNRLSATLWGPKQVYIVIGKNKIVDGGLDDGIDRIKSVACPENAKRLGLNTPCALTGKCNDCSSEQRMCNATLIIEKSLGSHPITVLIVNEELGY